MVAAGDDAAQRLLCRSGRCGTHMVASSRATEAVAEPEAEVAVDAAVATRADVATVHAMGWGWGRRRELHPSGVQQRFESQSG